MGFWSTVGDIAVGAAKHVKQTTDNINDLKQEYANKHDSYISKKCKNGNFNERTAALAVLKERGHDPESIKRMIMDS